MVHPKQFVSCSQEQMSEYPWFKDQGRAHQDRISCWCLARKSENSALQIKFRRGGQRLVVSIFGVTEGHRHRSVRVAGGFAADGLNLNNNDNSNEDFSMWFSRGKITVGQTKLPQNSWNYRLLVSFWAKPQHFLRIFTPKCFLIYF